MKTMDDGWIGQLITYVDGYGRAERGRVKSYDNDLQVAYVVYKWSDTPELWSNFTAQATNYADIWDLKARPVHKINLREVKRVFYENLDPGAADWQSAIVDNTHIEFWRISTNMPYDKSHFTVLVDGHVSSGSLNFNEWETFNGVDALRAVRRYLKGLSKLNENL